MSMGSSVIMKNSNYAINLSVFRVFAWSDNAIRDCVHSRLDGNAGDGELEGTREAD